MDFNMPKTLCIDLSYIKTIDTSLLSVNGGESSLRRNILCSVLFELGYKVSNINVEYYYVDDYLMDFRTLTESQIQIGSLGIPTTAIVTITQINDSLFNVYFLY